MIPMSFFSEAVQQLKNLSPDATPIWGEMSPQHMVEHVVGSWRISNGNAKANIVTDEEYRKKAMTFLMSDMPYEKNIPNPIFSKGLPPLRKPSYENAVKQLEQEIHDFFAYWEQEKPATEIHPVFGKLTFDQWLRFQTKHMSHHLRQFGIHIE